MVRIADERDLDTKYERTEKVAFPGRPGVTVTVGLSPPNHRNIISVVVPDRLVNLLVRGD